jgi:hypothetical protein
MPPAAVSLQGDQFARAFDRMPSRHVSAEVFTVAGGAKTLTAAVAAGSSRFYGWGVVQVRDGNAGVQGCGLVMFYYDGTTICSLALGSDLTGGGAHLTVAQMNTYLTWASTGGLQAVGVAVAGDTGATHVDLFIIDL